MIRIINGKVYDTEKAELVASDRYWERHGRNTFLYKTSKGNFFCYNTTRWQGERDTLVPLDVEEAKEQYEHLPEQVMDYKEAFGVEPEEA